MALRFYDLKVKKIKKETEEAYSISFDIPKELKEEFKYRHGQYLTLKLPGDDSENRRAYSISSSYAFGEDITVTVKKFDDGYVSRKICENVRKGDIIHVMPPMGHFTIELEKKFARNFILIGGGSGITPLMSILKTTLREEPDTKITLIYQNRNEDSIIFWNSLKKLEKKYRNNLEVMHILSAPSGKWNGLTGRIDSDMFKSILSDKFGQSYKEAEYFICGPAGLMAQIYKGLDELGIPDSQRHKELFTAELPDPAEVPPPAPLGAPGEILPQQVTVTLYGETEKVQVEPDETILQAAMSQGMEPPFSCQIGACSTCRAKLKSGKVHMDETEALTDDDIEQGYVLTCQSHPLTEDVHLDYDF